MIKYLKLAKLSFLALSLTFAFTSCEKDEEEDITPTPELRETSFEYNFSNGQVISSVYYTGEHSDDLTATMTLEELSGSETKITVELNNTVNGAMYMIHAHDAADPSSTPNGTPYNETPNGNIFAQMVTGNGGSVSVSQDASISYTELTTTYAGFFVVHDPLQNISTTDLTTYVILGSFARDQNYNLSSKEFNYDFNTGQVAEAFAYSGSHASSLSAKLRIQELGSGESRVTVRLANSLNGEMYMIHAHDAADPSTTPNGTPYNETPNSNLCTMMAMGNGGNVGANQISSLSYSEITANYGGFFVVHDPLQGISTTDPTTYVILGSFAR